MSRVLPYEPLGAPTVEAVVEPAPAPPPTPAPAPGHRRRRPRSLVASILLHLFIAALAFISLLPFFWLVCATLKRHQDMFVYSFLPWEWKFGIVPWPRFDLLTWSNFQWLFEKESFLTWLFNSVFISSAQTALVVTLSSLGGFALAKYQFRGKKPLMLLMAATMMLPSQVLLPSSYELMYRIGWLDSYAAIIVPGAVSVFGIFLFMQSMKAVPDELLQAGRVDGCSELRLWWEVALPIVRPMIGAFTLLSFMAAWNSFLWPQIVLETQTKYTLPIALTNMIGQPEYQTPYGVLMAGTFLSIVPVAVLFFILQRDFIAGLATGAVKG
jgi:ABC-type glycerol-3-phosphate transport system permease component